LKKNGDDIAAIIVEPVAGNMGVVKPSNGFLQGLREICNQHNAILIFDEVITGFRLSKGGAQQYYNVMPDITCMGKIIGGGLPVGAYGGREDIMNQLAPNGPVYQAGTLSGNPLAMAAGYTMLTMLNENDNLYDELDEKAAFVEKGFMNNLAESGVNGIVNRVGSMMTLFFTEESEVTSFGEAMNSDTEKYKKYFKASLNSGIYIAPSQFECLFISAAHTNSDLECLLEANLKALKNL